MCAPNNGIKQETQKFKLKETARNEVNADDYDDDHYGTQQIAGQKDRR